MIQAPTLEIVRSHEEDHPNALCCILFAPIFSITGRDGVIPRIAYLDNRSGENIHFYCVGYGGYWNKDKVPDMQAIGRVDKIPWAFSQSQFSAFVNELESETTWKYSGETEMIVLDPTLNFEDCVVFDLDRMTEDRAIDRPSEIFESLIQYSRNKKAQTAWDFSDRKAPNLFGTAILGALTEGAKAFGNTWKAGRHYATRSIKK